jgi:hypothetical protein
MYGHLMRSAESKKALDLPLVDAVVDLTDLTGEVKVLLIERLA